MMKRGLTKRLKAFSLFEGISDEYLTRLARSADVLLPETGDYIIYEGKKPNRVFFVEDGTADVYKQMGRRLVRIDTLHKGDYFGEIGIVLNCPATATVRSRENLKLIAIPAEVFRRFIEQHRSVFFRIFKTASERLSSTNLLQLHHLIDELGFFYNKFLDVQKIWFFLPIELVARTLRGELEEAQQGRIEEVTIYFLDIRHYTFFAEIHEPKEVLKTLNELLGRMAEIVIRNNGAVDKFTGDGLMAIFNSSDNPRTNAKNALNSALESVEFLREFNRRRYRSLEEEFYVGIGINSGQVVIGNIGVENMMMNFTAIGDVVNVASRICNLVGNNTISMTDDTYRLVSRRLVKHEVKKVGKVELKGRREPVTIYQIVPS